jgi:hypothetical protein
MALITPPLILTPFANAGDQTVIPPTDPNGFVNFSNGYTPDYEINLGSGDPQAKAVERGIQNYLFNALTTGLQAWQTSNRPPWYSGFPGGYAQYAEVVIANGSGVPVPYRSLVAGNVATPGSSSNWEYIQGSGEMIRNIPMPSGGPGGPGVMLISAATDFNAFTSAGTFQFQTDTVVSGSPNTPVNGGNQAAAGMLEVTAWANGSTAYCTQFFRDRNGLGFMRGGTNGSWSVWKIWANANQFVIGEVRMWSGTASQAAVTAAWGPGWHLCDGTLGTPNLRNSFVVGAGSTYAVGATGGAATVTLATGNLPAHNHGVTITDNGHTHAISQSPHNHVVGDPGHSHGVYDPGHGHVTPVAYVTNTSGSPSVPGGSAGPAMTANGVSPNTTGIAIYGNGTGITLGTAIANVSNVANTTGISASSTNTGSGTAFNTLPPYYALCYVMYTGS